MTPSEILQLDISDDALIQAYRAEQAAQEAYFENETNANMDAWVAASSKHAMIIDLRQTEKKL